MVSPLPLLATVALLLGVAAAAAGSLQGAGLPSSVRPLAALCRALYERLVASSAGQDAVGSAGSPVTTLLTAMTPPGTSFPQEPPSAGRLPVEATLSAEELIQHWGYPAEVHTLQTEDEYVLKLQRVPWGRQGPSKPGSPPRPVALFQHGLLQSSDQWLLRGPDRDLAFLMADQGYDVWLGNFRGNVYCKQHARMSKDNEKFWAFSWHENGYYDLAALIDYVLGVSGQPSLYYVGHSMATTALLVLLSSRPEYNHRVRAAVFMAPVAYFSHPRGVLGVAFPLLKQLERDLRSVHAEVLPHGMLPPSLVASFCHPGARTYKLCVAGYSQLAGPDMRQFNSTLFTTILSHIPAGSSLGQFVHYVQSWKTGQFRHFDHGARFNSLRYGQPQPPLYNLSSVVSPVLFFYSTGDYLASAKDVERLISEVPSTASVYKIPHKEFNHADYMWAMDTYELLYKAVLKSLRNY